MDLIDFRSSKRFARALYLLNNHSKYTPPADKAKPRDGKILNGKTDRQKQLAGIPKSRRRSGEP